VIGSHLDARIFASIADFRAWLAGHHDAASELWIGFYKKGVPKQAMTYVEAVEEALCWGWIDGLTRRLDDETRAIRFTPRRRTSMWSASNLERVARLTAEGRMQPPGVRAFEERDRRRDASYSYEREHAELPAELRERFRADPVAWAAWSSCAPSYRRTATFWVTSAKRPDTRERRFVQLLEAHRAGTRPRPFLVSRAERAGS
jgi:uncharacterized protein YdeI (YjbR/CyaY-like superfamily)